MAVNVKKIALKTAFISMICVCGVMTSCSQSGKGAGETPNRKQNLQKDKMNALGETVSSAQPTPQNPKGIGAEFTINTAMLFDHPEAAGIDKNQIITEGDIHYDIKTDQPSFLDVSKAGFLLCDVTIKNISLEYMNITDISLVCLVPDKNELKLLGLPAYFSKPKEYEDSTDYYNFELSLNQSMDAKVGWWVDLAECKKENLYLMLNYGGDHNLQQYWKLDL